jgi:hypothetical protein
MSLDTLGRRDGHGSMTPNAPIRLDFGIENAGKERSSVGGLYKSNRLALPPDTNFKPTLVSHSGGKDSWDPLPKSIGEFSIRLRNL